MKHLLIFSDDWGRHPSSCQHLTQHLLKRYPVTWVNTIAMRPPRLDRMTILRARKNSGNGSAVHNRQMQLPSPTPHSLQSLDVALDVSRLGPRIKWLASFSRSTCPGSDAIAITTLPIVAPFLNQLPVQRWIYYCVDDFALWPGLSGRALRIQERQLVKRAETVVAASENLAANLRPFHSRIELMTHGVDLEFWRSPSFTSELSFANREGPFAIFWGVVDRRMNADWVIALADAMEQGTVLLVGPQQDPDLRLLHHPRIYTPRAASY